MCLDRKKCFLSIGGAVFAIGIALALGILFGLKPYESGLPDIPTRSFTASQCQNGCNVTGTLFKAEPDTYPFISWDRYNISFMTEDVNSLCVFKDNEEQCEDIYDTVFSFCCLSVIGIRNSDPDNSNNTYTVTIKTLDTGTSCSCTLTPAGAWAGIGLVLIIFTVISIILCLCACCRDDGFRRLVESKDVRLPEWSDETGWTFKEKKKSCTIL